MDYSFSKHRTQSGGKYANRVERYRLEDDQLLDRSEILSGIKGFVNHDGGKIMAGR